MLDVLKRQKKSSVMLSKVWLSKAFFIPRSLIIIFYCA
ncbi:hypothetical protein P20652_4015 [Pseudoalteromonas sp. BSi20652]|nr:hypothetical protein P20652_4015 [Pseudoalteromonas sp. BSi20652]